MAKYVNFEVVCMNCWVVGANDIYSVLVTSTHNTKHTNIQFLLILNSKSVVAKLWFVTSWDFMTLRKLCVNPLHSNTNFKLHFLKINSYWSMVDLPCCISFCCTAKWVSYTYTYIHCFLDSIPIHVITEYWVEFPVLYSRFLLVIYFIYSSVYVSIPLSQFIPFPIFPPW